MISSGLLTPPGSLAKKDAETDCQILTDQITNQNTPPSSFNNMNLIQTIDPVEDVVLIDVDRKNSVHLDSDTESEDKYYTWRPSPRPGCDSTSTSYESSVPRSFQTDPLPFFLDVGYSN